MPRTEGGTKKHAPDEHLSLLYAAWLLVPGWEHCQKELLLSANTHQQQHAVSHHWLGF